MSKSPKQQGSCLSAYVPGAVAVLLPYAALFVLGCDSDGTGGRQQTAPPGRNIATPDKMVGEGGLPPTPPRLPQK